jgi:predicted HTH transcriptional regulator
MKSEIYRLSTNSIVGSEVVECLISNGEVAPKESNLWDYKEFYEADAESYAKTVRIITSLYNTYGGYVIYGIKEVLDDQKFEVVGVKAGSLDFKKLRGRIEKM